MRQLSFFFLILFAGFQSLAAQQITDAQTLHPQDSGLLTAGALDAAGNLYVASTLNIKTLPGESGIAGIFPAGDPVLSKFGPDGTLIWRREFPGNVARISDIALTPEENLVITGGYVDSFWLAPNWQIPGDESNGSFFIAQVNPAGDFMWIDTDVSTLPEDCIGWTLAVGPDAVYVAGMHEAIYSSLRRYSFDGTLQAEEIVDIRTISDLTLDDEGRLYAVGTAAPEAMFNNLPVPSPSIFTGYVNYIARLDTTFQAQWIRTTNYVTFDEHPRGAVFDGRPLLLSNDFDQGQNQQNVYQLKVYTPDGDLIRSDSIRSGFFFLDYEHFALQPFCDRLLLEYPSSDGGFALKSFDTDFQDSLLVQSSANSFSSSYPFICVSGDRAVFGSNFRQAELNIGNEFSLHNNHLPAPQQFVVELECEEASSGSEIPALLPAQWSLAPNPAGATVYVNRMAHNSEQEVRLQLLDAAGRLCWLGKSDTAQTAVSLEPVPAGVYFLQITGMKETVTLKGVKQ